MPGSGAEAVLDIRTNSGQFFADLDKAEKKSLGLTKTFSQVGKALEDAGSDIGATVSEIGSHIDSLTGHATKLSAVLGVGSTATVTTVAGIGAAIGLVVVEMHSLAEDAAHVGAALDDMADTSGVAVSKLSGIKFAADVTRTSLESINNAIFKFQERLGQNSEDVAKGLKRVGLSIAEIQALDPADQFLQIASAINGVSQPSIRAAAAIEIFGKQGRDLLPLLTKDLEGLIEKSEALGFTWTETDAKAAEAFEEKSNELRLTLSNLATVIGKDLIPAFNIALDVSNWTLAKFLAYGPPAEILDGFRRVKDFATGMQFLFDQRFGTIAAPKIASPSTSGATKGAGGFVTDADFTAATKAIADQAIQADLLAAHLRQLKKDVVPLTADQREFARIMLAGGDSTKEIAQWLGVAEVAVKKFDEAEKKSAENAKKAAEERAKLAKQIFEAHLDLIDSSEKETEAAGKAIAKQVEGMPVLRDLGVQMGTIALGSGKQFIGFLQTMGDESDRAKAHMAELTAEVDSFSGGLKKVFKGQFSAGFSELGRSIKGALDPSQILNTAIGGLLSGGLSAGINAVVGLATKGVKSLFGAVFHTEEKEVNRTRQAFVDAAGGIDALNRRAQAAGVTLDALLNAKKVKDYQKAVEDLNAAFEFQQQAMEDLDATIKKYKFSIQELGPALRRQQLDKQAQDIFHDWQVLAAAGIDIAAIAREMGDSINTFVQEAIRSGFEVPEALRPILEDMARMGQLTDEAGNAITDLNQSGLHFTMSMSQGFERLIKSVDRLTRAIARALGIAIDLGDEVRAAQQGSSSTGGGAGTGAGAGEPGGETREAAGDYLHLMRPRRFLAGEAGREDVVFGGAGRNLAQDVARELARLQPSASHAGASGGPAIIQLVVDSKVVAHAALDGIHAGGEPRSKFDKLVGRLR